MPAIITSQFRVRIADAFRLDYQGANVLYTFIGRPQPWVNDLVANVPGDNMESFGDSWLDMMSLKKVAPGDIALVAPRYDWTSGEVYDEYDSNISVDFPATGGAIALADARFYVLTDDFNIYKCIHNNGGVASTTKPTGTGTSIITTADGYRWKYLFTITAGDALKFLTSEFMPVRTDATVQAAAVDGAIYHIEVTGGGSGYTSTPNVVIVGDGVSAAATATVVSNVVTSITVTNVGSGYNHANVTIEGVGTGATARAVISPNNGHGNELATELNSFYVMINSRFEYEDGSGDFPIQNEFRRVGLVRNPNDFSGNLASASTMSALKTLTLGAGTSGNLVVDETITGTTSGAKAFVVNYDPATKLVKYVQTRELGNLYAFANAEVITGATSGATGNITLLGDPEVEFNSGEMLYIEQRTPIQRAADQIESVHLILEF